MAKYLEKAYHTPPQIYSVWGGKTQKYAACVKHAAGDDPQNAGFLRNEKTGRDTSGRGPGGPLDEYGFS